MDSNLSQIKKEVYNKCALEITNFVPEREGLEYDACRFNLNGRRIMSRSSKTTPKKEGQFVTFWKREDNGPIAPFSENDPIDFYVVNVRRENEFGQFVFPKSSLVEKGLLSTVRKEGKRAFRVYPNWETPKSKQATQTQKWQLEYFYELGGKIDINRIVRLYNNK